MYRAAFHAGQAGVFTKKEVVFFFEDRFFAQERALVNRFAAEGLPSLIERLHKAVGAPVNVQIDVPAMLATCVKKDARLSTARTLITRTKMSEKAQVAAKSTVPLPHLGPSHPMSATYLSHVLTTSLADFLCQPSGCLAGKQSFEDGTTTSARGSTRKRAGMHNPPRATVSVPSWSLT